MPEHGFPLDGKVAIVTGASRGIGAAIAHALGTAGADVVVNYHIASEPEFGRDNEQDAERVAMDISRTGAHAAAIAADVSSAEQVHAMFDTTVERFGGIDICVCNAGICPFSDPLDIPEAVWDRVQQVNLKGTFLCAQAAGRIMVRQGRGGRIIGMSSISALVGGGQQAHYTPTKAGIHSLMQSLAITLGPHQITCNSVMPGAITTDINADDWSDPNKMAYLGERIPLRRMGTPEDVADPVVFLASDAARYINGASLLIDGGMFVNLQ